MKVFINALIIVIVVAISGYGYYCLDNRLNNIKTKQSQLQTSIISIKQHLDDITAKLAKESVSGAYIEEPTSIISGASIEESKTNIDFSKEINE